MESTSELIQQLINAYLPEDKLEILLRLKDLAEDRASGFIIANVKELFTELEAIIAKSAHAELSTAAVNFLSAFISNSKDPEVALHIPILYPILLSTLPSTNTLYINSLQDCLCKCVQKTAKADSFLIAVQKHGVASENPIARKNSVELLVVLAKCCSQLMDDSKYGLHILKILESLLKNKENEHFRTAIIQLTQTHPSVYRLSKRLPIILKKTYDDLLATQNVMVDENDPNAYKEIDDAITAEITKKFAPIEPAPAKKQKSEYGIIPDRIIKDLNPASNWKQRAGAIEELEEIIADERACEMLKPYMPSFLVYLVGLLNDPNYKVAVTTLQIINKLLLEYAGIHTPESVKPLIPGLVEKLGDNKVMIRQLAVMGLRLLSRIIEPVPLLCKLLPHLTSPKWHTREEILNFIIISFLENTASSYPRSSNFLNEAPYPELIASMVPLLNDDKPKVVQMVFEACATVARLGNIKHVLGLLQEHVDDQETLAKLRYRIEADGIPVLTTEGVLEFPHIANELTTQNSFYVGGSKAQYNNLNNAAGYVRGQSRFTSAGPVKRTEERSIFQAHSAAKRPQTNNISVLL